MAKKTMIIENANIFWLNFSGAERKYNPAGRRNFCVDIDEELARQLIAEGWNIKIREPIEEGQDTKYHFQCELRFNKENPAYDPEVYLIADQKMTRLYESDVHILDDAEILNVDLEINPHDWGTAKGEAPAIKAYVKKMYVTIQPNIFDIKYAGFQTPDELPFD